MIENFDPNSIAVNTNNIFGLPSTAENSDLVIIPVPWEATVSYRNGTARAPEKILEASFQVDLYDADAPNAWKYGFYMEDIDNEIIRKNDFYRHCAELIINDLAEGGTTLENEYLSGKLNEINKVGLELSEWVYNKSLNYLKQGKLVALLGGDHSTPLGLIKALGEHEGEFGIIQIDAHMDLRKAYEGFIYSHASIMHNVIETVPQVQRLVQLGIRDYCWEEVDYVHRHNDRIKVYYDQDIKDRLYEGESWKSICDEIIEMLPQKVYISYDIDGLDPKLCANTGTPVNGGYEVEQISYLFRKIIASGRQIIGFDLVEVACGELSQDSLDANIGAHILHKLCNLFIKSNRKL